MDTSTPFHLLIFLDPYAIAQMPPDDYTFILLLLLGFSLGGFFYSFMLLRRARWIMDTPTSKISSAAQGLVELEGIQKNIEGQPIHSPLSNTLCTWYSYSVEKKVLRGKKIRWETVESDTSRFLFGMMDSTGECIINPEKATILGGQHKTWYGFTRQNSAYSPIKSWLFFLPYRYTEHLFKPQDPLYAIGIFHSNQAQIHTLSAQESLDRPYILSTIPQSKLIRDAKSSAAIFFILALLVCAIATDLLNFRPL